MYIIINEDDIVRFVVVVVDDDVSFFEGSLKNFAFFSILFSKKNLKLFFVEILFDIFEIIFRNYFSKLFFEIIFFFFFFFSDSIIFESNY